MITRIEARIGRYRVAADAGPVTLVFGVGKSSLIRAIHCVASNSRNVARCVGAERASIRLGIDGRFVIHVEASRARVKAFLSDGSGEVVLDRSGGRSVMRSPMYADVEWSGAPLDAISPSRTMVIGEETIEAANRVISSVRSAVGRVVLLGPCISPHTLVDGGMAAPDSVGVRGEWLAAVAARWAVVDPGRYEALRRVARHFGVDFRAGWIGKRVAAVVETDAGVVGIGKAPCTVRTALTVAAAALTRPKVLLLDGPPGCWDERVGKAVTPILRQYVEGGGQVIAEARGEGLSGVELNYATINIHL